MKILGLNWVWHLLYLAALVGFGFFGKNRLRETAVLKNEIGAVQQIALPKIQNARYFSKNEISKNAMAYPTLQYLTLDSAASRASKWVEAFGKKCDATKDRLHNGTRPDQINWRADLLDDFYRLGDSLSIVYGSDTARQIWLERCLFSGYRDFPPEQLATMLAASDTADASRLCRNLHLKAELALLFVLANLREKMQIAEIKFDRLMPALAYDDCPRVGEPFEADIFLAAYSTATENLKMKVNGKPVPIEAGLGRYKTVFKSPGEKKLMVEIQVRNPLTLEIKTYQKEFFTLVSAAQEMR